jgi:glycosyltransferase involved in cell wall biosynthesis
MPGKLRRFLWNIRKAPQRKWIGYGTLLTDIRGYLSIWLKRRELAPVSVCVGIKNRTSNLLEYVIGSLNKCDHVELIELSVFDCGSNDVWNLEQEIKKVWKGRLIYSRQEMKFARSAAFNRAIRQCRENLILICDADMSIPKDIVRKVNRYCTSRTAWFPVVLNINEDGSTRYRPEGTGMFASRKADFIKAGQYDEKITEWGNEDWLLYFAFYKAGIAGIRTREPEFIHHYHPTVRPDDFVPLF